jgi:hypothetical protein
MYFAIAIIRPCQHATMPLLLKLPCLPRRPPPASDAALVLHNRRLLLARAPPSPPPAVLSFSSRHGRPKPLLRPPPQAPSHGPEIRLLRSAYCRRRWSSGSPSSVAELPAMLALPLDRSPRGRRGAGARAPRFLGGCGAPLHVGTTSRCLGARPRTPLVGRGAHCRAAPLAGRELPRALASPSSPSF